ncbi:rho GTPase-activating protein 22 isoform X1 [Mauremys reevesii]|uniref:rho GTPase-activating protein 22 isoform X1 n=2 Tax=Mauremys reevesii TaxID=260615 RepID=UPI00193FF31C|nr:rho GTPase-activating protein 22 isoform X1 [Mauremys reevesii]XP_039337953.1 rho GTPase-activating protein 22 isoform X1 [Mauremys reevesii]XP_039337954.1 rho GTPase-activating protein 22 isoform X1 [Mauremys reevesii]XP_039337955.1 rho GTPase-activating protein 22 isoform X1 [Mauremys reevesii]
MGEQTGLPSRPSSPSLQDRVLKSGWLKKQRSIMKNWQQRWFVLRGDQLFYYKDEEETKPQGFIPLQGNQVSELTPQPEEPGKHLFEIAPGGAGDREKMPVNHEAFLLMANSQNEMEDWVKAIRRVIWAPFGGGIAHSSHARKLKLLPQGIFGQRLEDTVQYERKYGLRLAPLLVEQCVDFIRERGLTEEGLFRMPGQANLVKDLQDSFDCGEKPLFDSNTDVHTVASLLKLYLRELPEPVIPFAKYEDFLSCGQLLSKDKGEGTRELAKQVKTLPQANYNLLRYICKFLDEVQSHSSVNKMSVQNLATVFGPNILRPKMEDPVTIMEGTSLVQHLMTALISEHGQIFAISQADAAGVQPEARSVLQRSMVEWISEEDGEESRSEKSAPSPADLPSSSAMAPDATPSSLAKNAPQEHGSKATQPATSPSKRVQTLPTWKYSFRQQGARSVSPKLGSSSLDIPNLSSSGNWLMNGLYSLRGHRRTSSGERVKDSGSSQRLSTYDNVPSSSLSLSAHSIASTAWSTSSCEISVVDSVSSCPACRASDSSALSSLKTEWATQGSLSQSEVKTVDLENSMERFEMCISSCSEQSDLAAASKDSAKCSRALQSLVSELKTGLSKQRTEYESSIKRIEETSAELRKRVTRLEEELDQERKKYTMLEIKLRNSERAREDAEKRNQLLQTEMEEFFSTLGNLTVASRGAKVLK